MGRIERLDGKEWKEYPAPGSCGLRGRSREVDNGRPSELGGLRLDAVHELLLFQGAEHLVEFALGEVAVGAIERRQHDALRVGADRPDDGIAAGLNSDPGCGRDFTAVP